MRGVFKKILMLSTLLSLSACEVEVEDGRVPDEYLADAQKHMGRYDGEFQGHEGTLEILMGEGNRPYVVAHGFRNDDIIAPQCHSKFGQLITVDVDDKKKGEAIEVYGARFDFDAGDCSWWMGGRSIYFEFWESEKDERSHMTATIMYNLGRTLVVLKGEFIKVVDSLHN